MITTSSRWGALCAGLIFLCLTPFTAIAEDLTPEQIQQMQAEYEAWAVHFDQSLNRQSGVIALPNKVATLTVPEGFYYLSPDDSQRVLVEGWGNPEGEKPLGMLFPAGLSPLDSEAWGMTIYYSDEGYVDDEDAAEIDYSDMLSDMQADVREDSQARQDQGYESIDLVGWAAQPYYDGITHKLHWAKELRFGSMDDNTLNYNIRVLGREGYLLMNFIAGMDQLREIEYNLDTVLAMAEFNEGYRYDEFDPEYDKYAAYGIGGLVAGKVLAKTGLIAGGIIFLKKFGFFIIAGLAALGAKLFKRSKT